MASPAYAFVSPWQVIPLPAVAPANYCTLAELKAWLKLADTNLDALLDTCITDASRIIDGLCRVPEGAFAARALTRTFDVPVSQQWPFDYPLASDVDYDQRMRFGRRIEVPPLQTVTSLAVDVDGDGSYEQAWAATDYVLGPSDGPPYRWLATDAVNGRYRWPAGPRRVSVTGVWGMAMTVPGPIRRAAMLLASRLWRRADSPFGIMGDAVTGQVSIKNVDPDVTMILRNAGFLDQRPVLA